MHGQLAGGPGQVEHIGGRQIGGQQEDVGKLEEDGGGRRGKGCGSAF